MDIDILANPPGSPLSAGSSLLKRPQTQSQSDCRTDIQRDANANHKVGPTLRAQQGNDAYHRHPRNLRGEAKFNR